jgi:hypothetical protein
VVTQEAAQFAIDGHLALVNGGICPPPTTQSMMGHAAELCSGIVVGAGGVLRQQGELRVSVQAFLADGVRLASNASWLQLGSASISAGHVGHDRDFSLSTRTRPISHLFVVSPSHHVC